MTLYCRGLLTFLLILPSAGIICSKNFIILNLLKNFKFPPLSHRSIIVIRDVRIAAILAGKILVKALKVQK